MLDSLPTPVLLIDAPKLHANIDRMQRHCDMHGVRLWPHIKTHKSVEIARMQLEAGAEGLVCATLREAEAMLASGVRHLFIAYSLVDPRTQANCIRRLAMSLDTLMVAATSVAQVEVLGRVLSAAEVTLPVLMAVDTGLGREGARSPVEAVTLADAIRRHPRMRLLGLFTHEGHSYQEGIDPTQMARGVVEQLLAARDKVDPSLTIWPGCSVTATVAAMLPGVHAVRPGAYVFGDLLLSRVTGQIPFTQVALTVLTTVVDRPHSALALVDGGSKAFSSDRTPGGISASCAVGRDLHLTRLSEEHGWVTGADVDTLRIGERVRWVPAHVCPVVNLSNEMLVIDRDRIVDRWPVATRVIR